MSYVTSKTRRLSPYAHKKLMESRESVQGSGVNVSQAPVDDVQPKRCSKCKQRKALTEFSKDKGSSDGHRSQCKECANKVNRARSAEAKRIKMDAWLQGEQVK